MTPDVNVLIAAFRPGHPHHGAARHWLDAARQDCAAGRATLVLLPMVVAAFLRLVTSSRVFSDPDGTAAAVAFVDALLASAGTEYRGGETWPIFHDKVLARELRGNQVADGWIASAAEAMGEHLVTFDRDFLGLLPASRLTVLPGGERRSSPPRG